MQTFFKIVIFLHVFAGCSALITGALAMIYKSQTPKHRIAGKFYFWNMTFIFVSGLYLAVHRNSLFFIFISFFVYHTLLSAYSIEIEGITQRTTTRTIGLGDRNYCWCGKCLFRWFCSLLVHARQRFRCANSVGFWYDWLAQCL
jgi:uncharacterized membrane protein